MSIKSLVMLSYLFPPDGSIGALRVGKFALNLAKLHGWEIDVVTPQLPSQSISSTDTRSPFPVSVTVRETRDFDVLGWLNQFRSSNPVNRSSVKRDTPNGEPQPQSAPRQSTFRSALKSLSDLAVIPDPRSGWIYWACREAKRCIHRRERSVIFSSGPPHSAHVAAAIVKSATGRPWVADLRDPWSRNPYNDPHPSLANRCNRFLESQVLSCADAILCTTDAACEQFRQHYPMLPANQIISVPNGYDVEDLESIVPHPLWHQNGRSVLLHAGSIYGRRDPSSLLEAFGMLHAENPEGCPRLVFVGGWEPDLRSRADRIIQRYGIAPIVDLPGLVPREQALAAQAAADQLILLGDASPEMLQVPAKLFEYLWLQKPILSLFPPGAPAETWLQGYAPAFATATPDNPREILNGLRKLSHTEVSPRTVRPIHELSRIHQVDTVNGILNSLLA